MAAIKALIERNRTGRTPGKLVGFPFMLVGPSRNVGEAFDVNLDQDKRKLVFTAPSRMLLLGDIDVCALMSHFQTGATDVRV